MQFVITPHMGMYCTIVIEKATGDGWKPVAEYYTLKHQQDPIRIDVGDMFQFRVRVRPWTPGERLYNERCPRLYDPHFPAWKDLPDEERAAYETVAVGPDTSPTDVKEDTKILVDGTAGPTD